MISFVKRAALPVTATMAFSQLAHAQDAVVSAGDTAWILTATALVLFMSLPGLALFYGGLRDAVSGTIPESVFLAFQMTFAIITPALIVGAFVERVKFLPVLIFTVLWLLFVYAPVSMLWVGWFGFNGGSQLAADGGAGMALLVTHIAASMGTLVWIVMEAISSRKPTLVGAATGTIAGLATVTPAAGVLGPQGAILIGLAGGLVCYGAVNLIRVRLKIDDSLDVFAVHGVGGILGILLLPTLGLRVSEEQEFEGLDVSLHGESAYN